MTSKVLRLTRKKNRLWRHGANDLSFQHANKELKYAVRRAKRNYERKIARLSKHESKIFYGYLNSKLKSRSGIGPLEVNGTKITEPVHLANELNSYFSSVYATSPYTRIPIPKEDNVVPFEPFQMHEVYECLCNVDKNSSPGPDGITNYFLFNAKDILCAPLTELINQSYESGDIPSTQREIGRRVCFQSVAKFRQKEFGNRLHGGNVPCHLSV